MPRTKRVSDEDLLHLAEELLLELGVERVTLQQIGKKSGIAASTLLQRYGTKEKFLDAIEGSQSARIRKTLHKAPWKDLPRSLAAIAGRLTSPSRAANWLRWQLHGVSKPFLNALEESVESRLWQAAKAGQWQGRKGKDAARAIANVYFQEVLIWSLRGEGQLEDKLREELSTYLRKETFTDTPS